MARVTWTDAALRDVRGIHEHSTRDSRPAAEGMVRRLRTEGARLARFPELGRIVPEYDDPAFRELLVSPYRLVYRYQRNTDRVQVLMVKHGSRLLPSVPERE